VSNLLQELNHDLSKLAEEAQRSLVSISNGRRGAGAGTIWHPDGLILTNAHVVQLRSPKVTLPDGRTAPARVLAHDKVLDLAALSVDAADLPTIELGDSQRLQPGEWVLALGHPWGVDGAATAGTVGVGWRVSQFHLAHGAAGRDALQHRPPLWHHVAGDCPGQWSGQSEPDLCRAEAQDPFDVGGELWRFDRGNGLSHPPHGQTG